MLHGQWKGCYSYEVELKYRLICRVDVERKEVEFLAVGTQNLLIRVFMRKIRFRMLNKGFWNLRAY